MIDVYESYTSKAIISFRDTLFEHIPLCPYCGLGETVHLDHYLPKSAFSEYALYTDNLIPCCYKCNSTYKKTNYEEGGFRVYFHPYIDSVNDFDVLSATVRVKNGNVVINYGINARSGLGASTTLVLKKHFKHLKLGIRYLRLMNPLMIFVKIIKLRWIHILSYDQMVSRKINNQTTRCANSIFYTTLFTNSAPNYT
ncbi:HNH endonuclease signature motif containing protein [Vibrio vulnificus]|uniref:HNH endonuclease signature motif containing protein n=1 Tax=Vibrio vulnificus TaxID=672 RepID=UPI003873BB9E